MRLLYLGDIVGTKAVKAISDNIEAIKKEYKINMVFANGENVSEGKGLRLKDYKELKKAGISAISLGNHTFSKKEIVDYIDTATIARPANYTTDIGKEVYYVRYNEKIIALVNLLGRVYTNYMVDCPFKTMERLLKTIKADYIIVDFHGEATSEKLAFMHYFKNRVSAVLGTHTHVQTSDNASFDGCLYITDLGMCGVYNSILGDDINMIVDRFKTGLYTPLRVADGDEIILNGAILDFDFNKIERFNKIYTVK